VSRPQKLVVIYQWTFYLHKTEYFLMKFVPNQKQRHLPGLVNKRLGVLISQSAW